MPSKKTPKTKSARSRPQTPVANAEIAVKKDPAARPFPIVGLGASAGGLEALKLFFENVSPHSGMAYIVVVHMTPNQPSLLPDLLQNTAAIPVAPAKDGQSIEPDHVYVIPPDREIAVYQGKIQLLELVNRRRGLPIDLFLRSLAKDRGNNAVAVILSGTGSDGALGINDIKANDGLVLVQDEQSAGYNGMIRSAIKTGLADSVLPPTEMPDKLVQYFAHNATAARSAATAADKQHEWLYKIFAILRTQVGHDFSSYKTNTIVRRIDRRMGLNRVDSYKTYVRFLRENPTETEALFREMLIGVTSFFRDAESFAVLKADVFPKIFEKMETGAIFRAWIPGCSTGEEPYSLAMALRECLDKTSKQIHFQLFGTDIDSYAIDKAREGLFPASIVADVSQMRLERFFTKEGDFFRIRKNIRDCVVFSEQDVIKDPPFSRLNLLCCRNLLIYLDANAQKRLLPLFHYTLNPDGVMVLGTSETIGGFSTLFKTVDKKWKIYRRLEVPPAMRQIVYFPSGLTKPERARETLPPARALADPHYDIGQLAQQALLDQFAPSAVLTNGRGDILHVIGRTGKYLETPSGPPTTNVLDLARPGLRIELSSALRAAKVSVNDVTRRRISVRTNGASQLIDLHISPQKKPPDMVGNFLVVFEDVDVNQLAEGARQGLDGQKQANSAKITELERELQITRESHQTTIEELESSNEELKSTNEEMQSANEELQSTNEELESSREELQSLNEELQTVNAELQSKVEELSAAHDDMRNLLNSTEIATVFVDNEMRIRRFTPEAIAIINLIQTDIGRPLQHVANNLKYDNMIPDLTHVLRKLIPKVVEVQTIAGNWYSMRIIPYRTTDNRIDGAVLTFSAIENQKKSQNLLQQSLQETQDSRTLIRSIFDINPEPIVVLDNAGRIIIANQVFSDMFRIQQADLPALFLAGAEDSVLKNLEIASQLQIAIEQNQDFEIDARQINTRRGACAFTIKGRIIRKENNRPYHILLNFIQQS